MEFVKYNSIENSYRGPFIERCAAAVGDAKMVALEKIHGANFSWIVDATGIRVASRSDLIGEDETFYGHTRFYQKYAPVIKTIFDIVSSEIEGIKQVSVFGEIFGGSYSHMPQVPGAKRVQSGVNYHPDNEFMAFDIKLVRQDGLSRYLSYLDMVELIDDANACSLGNLMVAPVIAIGTLEELIKIDPLFHTRVPAAYGLPEMVQDQKTDLDYAEGFVIRGYDRDWSSGEMRVILKQKNALYGEKEKVVRIKSKEPLTEAAQELLDKVCSYLNENRVHAVLSKGEYDQKAFGRLQGDVVRDALEDFEKDEGYSASKTAEWSEIAKRIGTEASLVIRPVWVSREA